MQEKHFGFDEETRMLHLDGKPLYCTVPDDKGVSTLRAFGRLAADVLDSKVGVDGTCALPRAPAFGSLPRAVANILAAGGSVKIVTLEDSVTPCVSYVDDTHIVFRSARTWSDTRLVDVARDKRKRYADAMYSIVHDGQQEAAQCGGYEIHVQGLKCTRGLVAHTTLEWRDVVNTPNFSFCLTTERCTECVDGFSVKLFRNDILWQFESHISVHNTELRGVTLYMNATTTTSTFVNDTSWIPMFPRRISEEGADMFAATMLHAHLAVDYSKSNIVKIILHCAHMWRSEFRKKWHWRDDQEQVNAIRNTNVCDELTTLMDIRPLMRQMHHDERIHLTGLAVLRRMQPTMCSTRTDDWRASAIAEHSISRFLALPIGVERLCTLRRLGCMDSFAGITCEYGILNDFSGTTRTIAVSVEADARVVTMAVAHLTECSVHVACGLDVPELAFQFRDFEALHCDTMAACEPDEEVWPYKIKMDETGIRLCKESGGVVRRSSEATSIDALVADEIPVNQGLRRRMHIRKFFPNLAGRLAKPDDPSACVREVQARKAVREWCLSGINDGRNLSSLGLSILLAITFNGWLGARVRVYLSRNRAAVFGYWKDTDFTLVNPTNSALNAFDLASSMTCLSESGEDFCLRKNTVVLIKKGHTWRAASVENIYTDTMSVKFLINGNRENVALHSHSWQRLARFNNTDVDRVIQNLLKDARRSSVSVKKGGLPNM